MKLYKKGLTETRKGGEKWGHLNGLNRFSW